MRKAAKASASEELTPTRELQLAFWTEFEKRLRETGKLPSTQSPRPRYWFNVAFGRTGIHLSCLANTWEKRIGVRVYISGKIADQALEQLSADKETIEQEIGAILKWDPHPEKSDRIILLDRTADIAQKDRWDEFQGWLVDSTIKMRKAFAPRAKALDLG